MTTYPLLKTLLVLTAAILLLPLVGPMPSASAADDCANSIFGCFEVGFPGDGTEAGASIDKFADKQRAGNTPIINILKVIMNVIIGVIVAIGLIVVVVSGYVYMTAGGDGGKVGKSKEMIAAALLGITLALTSYLILNTISPQFASELEEPDFGHTP